MQRQSEIEKIAERRGAKFLPRSLKNIDADFYTTLPGKPKEKWRKASISISGADLKPGKYPPCPLKQCPGNGLKMTHDTGAGRKSYAICECQKKRS